VWTTQKEYKILRITPKVPASAGAALLILMSEACILQYLLDALIALCLAYRDVIQSN
jgi:hypothetical protein